MKQQRGGTQPPLNTQTQSNMENTHLKELWSMLDHMTHLAIGIDSVADDLQAWCDELDEETKATCKHYKSVFANQKMIREAVKIIDTFYEAA